MKIKYSPESIADLNRLVEFIEAKNPYAARRIAIDMQEAFDNLKRFPKMGLPVLKSHDPELIRDLYINHYVARYLISDDVIYILRIWHNKENERSL
jgi:plasmid stabilization system protein ParE